MPNLNDVAAGESLDWQVDDTPVRCRATATLSGMRVQCDRIGGHDGAHRMTATWVNGVFL